MTPVNPTLRSSGVTSSTVGASSLGIPHSTPAVAWDAHARSPAAYTAAATACAAVGGIPATAYTLGRSAIQRPERVSHRISSRLKPAFAA
ncbi:MAG TPA: hypothetical protein VHT97_07035 [Acidimicrobiales bacterium]|nr:hypothetical protein [Acidimicrobiales bacterium]